MVDRDNVPPNLIRASISMSKNMAQATVQCVGRAIDPTPPTRVPSTLRERIQTLPESAKWALQHLQIADNGEAIAQAIWQRKAIAMCDGGLKYGLGTAAFVLEGQNNSRRIKGVNKAPGPIKEGDLLRCKLSGIYAVLTLVGAICKLHQITSGSITIWCDSTSALKVLDPEYLPDQP
jgi:hypothetical protein